LDNQVIAKFRRREETPRWRLPALLLLLRFSFFKPGFLEAEEPGKVGVQNIGGRVWEQV